MRTKKGFTLIELLVVIAIIALLLSILMPSLRLAKDHAKKIQCSANIRSMATAARMYAESHDGFTPSASNLWQDSSNNIRAGWCGRTVDGRQPLPEDEQVEGRPGLAGSGLKNGQLWPYIETADAWRCSADPIKEQMRSYCMAGQWWSRYTEDDDSVRYDPGTTGKVYRKLSGLSNASGRFMFLDYIGYNVDAYAAIWYSQKSWWNVPMFRHTGGSVNAYADGHVEGYKLGRKTLALAEKSFDIAKRTNNTEGGFKMADGEYNLKDLEFYQRGTWGEIGWRQ